MYKIIILSYIYRLVGYARVVTRQFKISKNFVIKKSIRINLRGYVWLYVWGLILILILILIPSPGPGQSSSSLKPNSTRQQTDSSPVHRGSGDSGDSGDIQGSSGIHARSRRGGPEVSAEGNCIW